MATECMLELSLGYHPMFGRANPMPEDLSKVMGDVEVINFHVRHIGERFYEVTINYLNVHGAQGERFDFTESVAGKIGETHRLTYGRQLRFLYDEIHNLLHIAISKD